MSCKNVVSCAALLTIVIPVVANATVVGTYTGAGNCYPFGCSANYYGGEYQQVYTQSAFSGITSISSLTFYQQSGTSLDSGLFNVYLSTTSAAVNGLSNHLANNIGADETLVYSGVLPSLSGGQLNLFLSTSFNYDPSAGNLLLTVTSTNNSPTNTLLEADLTGTQTSRGFGVSTDRGGLVTGFNVAPVPLPASVWTLVSGFVGLASLTRRRRAA